MKKCIWFILCALSISQVAAYAENYDSWPAEFTVPSTSVDDGKDGRFNLNVAILPKSNEAETLSQHEVGVLVTDMSGVQQQKEVKATYYKSSVRFIANVDDLFPGTQYKFVPYIVVNGHKCLSPNSQTVSTGSLMRDQSSLWNDYFHTATTITIRSVSGNKLLQIWEGEKFVDIPSDGYKISDLDPRTWFASYYGETEGIDKRFRLYIGDDYKIYDSKLYTARLNFTLTCKASPTGLLVTPQCNVRDADVSELVLVCGSDEKKISPSNTESIWYGGLEPKQQCAFQLYAVVKSKSTGNEYKYHYRKYVSFGKYTQTLTFTTSDISFGEVDVKGVSSSATIASVTSNIDDRETKVGFMWKKYDAPASLKPSQGYCVLYNGVIEGKISNLQSQSYYNIRPFYLSDSGKYYYGEWVTFDPSDFSYIEPILRIYSPENIGATNAQLKGYALDGSDDIIEQGFEYWPDNSSQQSYAPNRANSTDIKRVASSGVIMTASLENLAPNTKYQYRVYAITNKGEYFSDTQTFQTEYISGIENIDSTKEPASIIGYYTIQGQKLTSPQRGLNIVVYSDGSTKKMIFK